MLDFLLVFWGQRVNLVRHQNGLRVILVHWSEVMGILVHQQSMAQVTLVHWSLGLVILVHQKETTDLLHASLNLTQLRVISGVCLALWVLFSPW